MSARPRRRRLTGDEAALWAHVTAGMRPLSPVPPAPPALPSAAPVADPAAPARPPAPPVAPPADTAQPPRLDARRAARLERGRMTPEARIDLHGMTLAHAHPALSGFILRAQARGLRLVLVITGKGDRPAPGDDGPIPAGRGILRRQVPHWLGQPPLAALVLDIRPAHPRHGGAGAFYVWLRRPRGTGLQPRPAGG
jgi:DNA-nicking Smr family endonuclease